MCMFVFMGGGGGASPRSTPPPAKVPHTSGGSPGIDQHPIQRGVAVLMVQKLCRFALHEIP